MTSFTEAPAKGLRTRGELVMICFGLGFLFSGCGNDALVPSGDDYRPWEWQEVYPADDILSVAAGDHGFFAVGRRGLSKSSEDGISWQIHTHAPSRPVPANGGSLPDGWVDVVARADGWVIVDHSGNVEIDLRDVRGRVASLGRDNELNAIASSEHRLIAVGGTQNTGRGVIFRAADPAHWVSQEIEAPLHDVLWDGQRFVAVGDRGLILTSPDGEGWTPAQVPTDLNLVAIAFGHGRYVALTEAGVVLEATDPDQWSHRTDLDRELRSVAFTGEQFVAVGKGGSIFRSDQGLAWRADESGTLQDLNAVAAYGGVAVAVGNAGVVLRSTDDRNWERQFGGLPSDFSSAIWTGQRLVVVDLLGGFLTSTNGQSWTYQQVETGPPIDIAEYPGGYVALSGNGKKCCTSTDGSFWTERASDHPPWSISAVIWFRDHFIGLGPHGGFYTSTDGTTWAPQPSFTDEDLGCVTYGAGLLLATGYYGAVFTSTDGVHWERAPHAIGDVHGVRWTALGFLAVNYNAVWQSANGVDWTAHRVPNVASLYGYFVQGTRVYVLGYNGRIAYSDDLSNWMLEESGTSNSLRGGVALPDRDIIVGENGTLLMNR